MNLKNKKLTKYQNKDFILPNMNLKCFFDQNKKIALAYSGGVDSVYLMFIAKKMGVDCKAYFIKSAFQPEFELSDAEKFASEIGFDFEVLENDVLKKYDISKNDFMRCYYCKKQMLEILIKKAKLDGYDIVIDGTNASDNASERAGMKVLKELKIMSPLKLCNISKEDVRILSQKANLSSWNKPSYSCLATRIKTGQEIDKLNIKKIEYAEKQLFDLGFLNFRVRLNDNNVLLEFDKSQNDLAIQNFQNIENSFLKMFDDIKLGEFR